MNINSVPTEVLSLIISYLPSPAEDSCSSNEVTLEDLRNARLVCRKWNEIALPHLFRDVALLHKSDTEIQGEDFTSFLEKTASPVVQNAARCAVIYSGPHHGGLGMDGFDVENYEGWDRWDSGEFELFQQAVQRIAKLPKLQAVHLRFTDKCGRRSDYGPGIEEFSTRMKIIKTVFRAIEARKTRPGMSTTINTLVVEHLQNRPMPEFVQSDLFRSVAKDITHLRLRIAEEYNEHGPDHDLDCEERRTFEPWLRTEFLPIFSSQLTSLHLAFNENWGVCPGYFDGKGLVFPHLKTLTLNEFIIGHHDQFDWVLAQTSLETLRLHRCMIVSHLSIGVGTPRWPHNSLVNWGVRTHDWKEHPPWAFGFHEGKRSFTFSGVWETVFEAISSKLPHLIDFRFDYGNSYSENWFNMAEDMRCQLSCVRYVTLDTGLLPSPWILTKEGTGGVMSFGNNDPNPIPVDERQGRYGKEKCELNRARETLEGDSRAFTYLMQTIEERRRQKGLAQISV
ncbi:hypothetical protein B0T16DRAFT_406096 [Cercophora newfieldiana]|uniref:F-box domain-containing protein n=1 Tax=Cercophora newfieldiana TaxID=92897 RepID=A0AA39YH11_9PEZI|nr:hypothetical protein B0T16DRAFT_406096 [Cercophora newfieldiana]